MKDVLDDIERKRERHLPQQSNRISGCLPGLALLRSVARLDAVVLDHQHRFPRSAELVFEVPEQLEYRAVAIDNSIVEARKPQPAAEAVHGYLVGARAELEHTPDREVPEEQMLPSCRTIGSHTKTSYPT